MRCNEKTVLLSDRTALVPYLKEHVLQYHAWMEDDILRDQTASERLTLEEEYAMQKSWHEDERKLTFIVVDPTKGRLDDIDNTFDEYKACKMIGDVNAFLHLDEDEIPFGEIELMIAEPQYRGRGLAVEILGLFLRYLVKTTTLDYLAEKISTKNERSIRTFRSVGFRDYKRIEVFDELEMRLEIAQVS